MAHTITDCQGFYQFDVGTEDKCCDKVLVSRTVEENETVIPYTANRCSYNKGYESRCQEETREKY